MELTVEVFQHEIDEALRNYDKYLVCLEKTTEQCRHSLLSLVGKAIKAYRHRQPHLRHGIALDRELTVIISQAETERPLCGIYFNLSSPYRKKREPAKEPAE